MTKLYMQERRMQEAERLAENIHRLGHIDDVKFDDKNKRWMVKFRDGPAQNNDQNSGSSSSGSGSGSGSGRSSDSSNSNFTVMTDWLPWESMSHSTILCSIPPKKGQKAQLASPNGKMEMGSVRAFSYGKGSESPHDKQDEIFIRVRKEPDSNSSSNSSTTSSSSSGSGSYSSDSSSEDTNEQMDFHVTKDGFTAKIGNASYVMTANSHTITMGKHTMSMNTSGISMSVEGGKSTLNLTKDSIKALSDLLESKSTDGSASVKVDNSGVNTQGKKINTG